MADESKYDIVAATGCPTGIAHTFMAKEALEKAAAAKGLTIKVETHGQVGVENELTAAEIRNAKAVVVAADKDVQAERFAGKPMVNVGVTAAIKDAEGLIDRALVAQPEGELAEADDAPVSSTIEKESVGHIIYKHLMNGVSHMLVFVVAGGVLTAVSFLWGITSFSSTAPDYNSFAAMLKIIGGIAMGLMVPVLSAYIAESIGKRPALVPGFVAGMIAIQGNKSYVGTMSELLQQPAGETSFDEGLKSVSKVLVSFMLIMCPIVFFANGFLKGDWFDALLFSVSVAVGITPQMLPVIVTTCLSRGGTQMAKQDVIVKNPAAIQNLGAMDILCTDKTGTITADEVVLERHLNILGEEDPRVLRHAYLNSYFQTGLRNLIDKAIIKTSNDELPTNLLSIEYEKIDEVPFDFERRRMSVVVKNTKTNKTHMITKGAVEEVLNACSFVDLDSEIKPLTSAQRKNVMDRVYQLNQEGMRVVGVAQKSDPRGVGEFGVDDERDMVLIGYLAFLDPPKESAREAIAKLNQRGVQVKVLTGDNEGVAAAVCKKVGIHVDELLLGSDVENLNDEQLKERVEKTQLFAKLSPMQKARVVSALRSNNHVVGFMGDGINDAAAMRSSDVGISVDTAVDVAKESADIILLQKDLLVLEHGVEEGRRTYGNTIKYIKATASSNFGNVLSVLVASFFLPFLPMSALQLLLLGLAYTVTCIAIPWDNVDDSFLSSPRSWDAHSITNFMLWIGPISSIFDVLTFALMFFVVSPALAGGTWAELAAAGNTAAQALFILSFQTGWFIESMWTQTFVLHALRTNKIPFIQSMPSASLLVLTTAGIIVVSALPYLSVFAQPLSLVALPLSFFGWLTALMSGYMVLITIIKSLYVKRFGSLL